MKKNKLKFLMQLSLILLFMFVIVYIMFLCISGNYSQKANLQIPRAYHKSIPLNNSEVLIIGGVNGKYYNGITQAEIYFINDNVSKIIGKTNINHIYHELFKMSNGNIVIADINGIEIYDVKNKKFKLLKTKPKERYCEFKNYKFELFDSDLLFVAGGRDKNTLNNVNLYEIIDLKNDKLLKLGEFRGNGFGITKLQNDNLVVAGGKRINKDKEELSSEVFIFNTKKMEFEKFTSLSEPIFNPFVFLKGDEIIVLGGEVLEKYEKFNNKIYPILKGSPYIQIIKSDKSVKKINISKILKSAVDNVILNAQKLTDNLYWLQLKDSKSNNTLILDLNKIKEKKVFRPPLVFPNNFMSSAIFVNQNLLISGGKLMWEEPCEYSIFIKDCLYTKECNTVTTSGLITDDVILLNLKM